MGRARRGVHKAFDAGRHPRSRVPELLIALDDTGVSVGAYTVTDALKQSIDSFRVASTGDTRVFTPYGRDADALVFSEQMCAIMGKPVERFRADTAGIAVELTGVAGTASVVLAPGSARRMVTALAAGEALIFESDDGAALTDVQALLSVSLNGSNPLPLALFSEGFSGEVEPTGSAYAFFPIRYLVNDARLQPFALVGGRALALDDYSDPGFLTSSDEVALHALSEAGADVTSTSPRELEISRDELLRYLQRAGTAMRGRAGVIASAGSEAVDGLRAAAANAETLVFSQELVTAAVLAAANIGVAAAASDTKLIADISPEEMAILVTESALQPAVGVAPRNFARPSANLIRSLDYLLSSKLTGVAREFTLLESLSFGLVQVIDRLFTDIYAVYYDSRSLGD